MNNGGPVLLQHENQSQQQHRDKRKPPKSVIFCAIDSKPLSKVLKVSRFGGILFRPRRQPWTLLLNGVKKHLIIILGSLTIVVVLCVMSALGVGGSPQDLDSRTNREMPAYLLPAYVS